MHFERGYMHASRRGPNDVLCNIHLSTVKMIFLIVDNHCSNWNEIFCYTA